MSQADPTRGGADAEASGWFARLKRRRVSLADLDAFQTWREKAENRAAYERADQTWRNAEAITGATASPHALGEGSGRGAMRSEPPRAWFAVAVATAGALLVGAAGTWFYVVAHPNYVTGVGEQQLIRLTDGSTVRLDTDSRIDVAFSGASRQIELERGQAFFDVAHDARRPFLVTAGPATVRAAGTAFDVRAEGDAPEVILVEGVVEVRRAGARPLVWRLSPGELLVVAAAARPRPVDAAAATSWTSGRLVFKGVPLSAAIEEINRYCVHKIVLRAPALADTPVSGSFETANAARFVAAVSDPHGLRATQLADGRIALDAAAPTGE